MKRRIFMAAILAVTVLLAAFIGTVRPPAPVFYKDVPLSMLREKARTGDPEAIRGLNELGEKAVPGLVYTLRTHDSFLRLSLWSLSGKLPPKQSKWTRSNLTSPSLPTAREESAYALGLLG